MRAYKLGIIQEVLDTYPVDGIFLDWIRTGDVRDPQVDSSGVADYGYERILLDGFKTEYGIDPQSIPNHDMRWVKYRAEPQTEFMRSVRKLANSKSPKLPVAVMVQHPWSYRGDNPQYADNLQGLLLDVKAWASEGLMDAAVAAGYYAPNSGGTPELAYEHLKELTGGKIDIWMYAWVPTTAETFRTGLENARKLSAKQILYWEADYIDNNPHKADLQKMMSDCAAMPAGSPAALDKNWAWKNFEEGWAAERKKNAKLYGLDDGTGNGIPNHQQDDGKGSSNPGPNPGGPPAGTNKPDPSGMAGRPGPQPGTDNQSNERQEDMGPMPPPGETTVEFENEYGPPPPEKPARDSRPFMSDEEYQDFRGCLLYGCSNLLKTSDASGTTGDTQGDADGGGDDNGSSTEDDSGSDDNSSSSDDEEEKDDDNNSSSGSDDGGDTSEVGYTPGADGAGGSQPAGAEELKYSLFQKLGYLFHSRNFGPRFPLVGDPRPETGGPEGHQNGPHGNCAARPVRIPIRQEEQDRFEQGCIGRRRLAEEDQPRRAGQSNCRGRF